MLNKYISSLIGAALLLFIVFTAGCDQLAAPQAEVGKLAPTFTLSDLNGKRFDLKSLRGKVVFINFWATWCPPCIEELPSMEMLNNSIPESSFQMLTILYNDKAEIAEAFAKKQGYTFPILVDPNTTVGKTYGITGVPETYIIDPEGILREKFLGPREWNSEHSFAIMNKYLPQAIIAQPGKTFKPKIQLNKAH